MPGQPQSGPPAGPTSGGAYPPPGPPPGAFPPPGGPQPPGGGFPPPPGQAPAGGFPPPDQTSTGGFPPPGQGQPGYGYDPNTQPGFGDPGQPPFGAAPGAPLPPMAPPGRQGGGRLKLILAIVGAVLLLCCIGSVALYARNGLPGSGTAGKAKVGDCLSGKSIDKSNDKFQPTDLEIVKCSDGEAKYKVVGKVENKTVGQATDEVCKPFTGAEIVYWEGRENEKGTVLCLQTK